MVEKRNKILIIALALVIGLSSVCAAENDKPTSNEIAKELANPNTVLTSLTLQNQYFSFDGDLPRADEQDMFKFYFQPVLPFPLKNGKTLWVRPGVPFVIDQPVYDTDSRRLGSQSGLGDITLDVQYGKTLESGFLWSIGFSSIFPTAFKEGLGSEVFALGPGFQLGRIRGKSIFGVFANHLWDIAGESKSSPDLPYLRRSGVAVNLTTIQLFGVVLPGNAWKVGSTPTITYNHESEYWMVPLHLVVGKTLIISERPWEFSLELNYYVERPDAIAPEWMLGFNVAPVVTNVFAE